MPKKSYFSKGDDEQKQDSIHVYDVIQRVKLISKAFEKKERLNAGETEEQAKEPQSFM
jgi:nucleoside-diphosphate-sugar epimerase